jgi:hypothetical protein
MDVLPAFDMAEPVRLPDRKDVPIQARQGLAERESFVKIETAEH